jgi:hypothetical protein
MDDSRGTHTPLVQSVTPRRYTTRCGESTRRKTEVKQNPRDGRSVDPRSITPQGGSLPDLTPFRSLSRSFMISLCQFFLKCVQHEEGRRRHSSGRSRTAACDGRSFWPIFHRSNRSTRCFISLASRGPLFRVDVPPPSRSVFTLDEGCVWSLSLNLPEKYPSTIVGSHSFIFDSPEWCTYFRARPSA